MKIKDSFLLCVEYWTIFVISFISPLVLIPTSLTVLALYFANQQNTDKTFSFFLQIMAALLFSVAGAVLYDNIKRYLQKDMMVKKGYSAVRNLIHSRDYVKSILKRVENEAKKKEVSCSLILLEKNISIAIQEVE